MLIAGKWEKQVNTIRLVRIIISISVLLLGAEVKATIQQIQITTHRVTDNISISIYVPKSNIQKTFPTLYLMDGQHYFHSSVGIQNSLNHRNITIPNFIVVAINTSGLSEPSELRHQLLNSRSEEMRSTLIDKIIPLVESTYPTSEIKIYFGWEHAAGFGLDLVNFSDFNRFLLASAPNVSRSRIDSFQSTLLEMKKIKRKLYMSLGDREFSRVEEHELLSELVKSQNDENFDLELNLTKNYGHFTTPIDVLTNGLMWIFSDFNELNFNSIEEITQFGGINGVINYYEERANTYQVPNEIPENTKFTMARHAVEGDNKKLLDEVIDRLGRFDTGGNYWGYYFAKFAFDKNDDPLAQQFIATSMSTNKPNYRLLTLQGDIEARAARLEMAKHFYEQALMETDVQDFKNFIQDKIKALGNI